MDIYNELLSKKFNIAEYGEIINGELTYKTIADKLLSDSHCLIGWTDEIRTHYDILFLYKTSFAGINIQGGIRCNYLFISIMRKGSFGFEVNGQKKSSRYIAEKLNLYECSTTEKLAELINNIIKLLKEK